MKKRKRKAFTLVELIAVAFILGVIGAFVVPNVWKRMGRAKSNIAKAKITKIESALQEFQLAVGRFPSEAEGLDALIEAPEEAGESWDGPYLRRNEILDPWDNPYVYTPNPGAAGEPYMIMSYGADGEEGGENENADISNIEME